VLFGNVLGGAGPPHYYWHYLPARQINAIYLLGEL